jgi:hypothetical protein
MIPLGRWRAAEEANQQYVSDMQEMVYPRLDDYPCLQEIKLGPEFDQQYLTLNDYRKMREDFLAKQRAKARAQ